MVDRVHEKPFNVGPARKIYWPKKGSSHRKAGGKVTLSLGTEKMAKAQQTLSGNGACRRIDWLIRIRRLRVPFSPISQFCHSRCARVPVADTIACGCLADIEIAGSLRSLQ